MRRSTPLSRRRASPRGGRGSPFGGAATQLAGAKKTRSQLNDAAVRFALAVQACGGRPDPGHTVERRDLERYFEVCNIYYCRNGDGTAAASSALMTIRGNKGRAECGDSKAGGAIEKASASDESCTLDELAAYFFATFSSHPTRIDRLSPVIKGIMKDQKARSRTQSLSNPPAPSTLNLNLTTEPKPALEPAPEPAAATPAKPPAPIASSPSEDVSAAPSSPAALPSAAAAPPPTAVAAAPEEPSAESIATADDAERAEREHRIKVATQLADDEQLRRINIIQAELDAIGADRLASRLAVQEAAEAERARRLAEFGPTTRRKSLLTDDIKRSIKRKSLPPPPPADAVAKAAAAAGPAATAAPVAPPKSPSQESRAARIKRLSSAGKSTAAEAETATTAAGKASKKKKKKKKKK